MRGFLMMMVNLLEIFKLISTGSGLMAKFYKANSTILLIMNQETSDLYPQEKCRLMGKVIKEINMRKHSSNQEVLHLNSQRAVSL